MVRMFRPRDWEKNYVICIALCLASFVAILFRLRYSRELTSLCDFRQLGYYGWDLYYAWFQRQEPINPIPPKVITHETFITLRSKCYYRWYLYYAWVPMFLQRGRLLCLAPKLFQTEDLYYVWVQMLSWMGPLLRLGKRLGANVITDGTIIPTHMIYKHTLLVSLATRFSS